MSKTIAAVATGNSVSGIGVIRISGENAISVADRVFRPADGSSLCALKGYTAKYGSVFDGGQPFDNAVALVFRAPKSYTGENVVEISVHGGLFIVEKTLEAIYAAGASPAEPGEFTKRAFLNGKIDLAQAESVASLISASGQEAAKASYSLLQGSLSNKIQAVAQKLADCSALMAAWVDYPDEEIPELKEDALINTLEECAATLELLIENYENGSAVTEGVATVIAGKPNAGKSTLMNMLSGTEKSIVTDIRGTTRDIVENSVRLGSITLHLSDTAGIRDSSDPIEKIGIEKALRRIDEAALVLAVFDGSEELNSDDEMLINACEGKRAIAVINKTDLPQRIDASAVEKKFDKTVYISAGSGSGERELENAAAQVLGVSRLDTAQPILANARQKQCVKNALENVNSALDGARIGVTYDAINVMIDSALDELLTLTGKKASEEVVNNIFSKFCVGK